MLTLITFLFTSFVLASDTENIVEKTYPRSNTFCQISNRSIEFQIRGISKFTESKDRGFGEYAFYRKDDEFLPLPINQDRMDSFEFFEGGKNLCNRSHGYNLGKEMIAILFLKENSPYKGKLTIQLFDTKLMIPKEAIETTYSTNKAIPYKDGFAFESVIDRTDIEMEKVTIDGITYNYQDRHIHPWISYSSKGFEIQPGLTFDQSEWKDFFKDEKDFLNFSGWDPKNKDFTHKLIYIAVNYEAKKSCLLMVSEKTKLTGNENWRCRQQKYPP